MTCINLLHISDIHFGISDPDEEQDKLLNSLYKALTDCGRKIDLILCTGDLTQKASPTEFQEAQDWLLLLSALLNCPIALCPGNHDVDRTKTNLKDLRTAYPNNESFNLKKKDIRKSHEHLKPFLSWYKEAKANHSTFINTWDSNVFGDSVEVELNGVSTSIICLNSAALSCGDDDIGKLCIDPATLNSFLSAASTNEHLIIVVAHHPLEKWMVEWNAQKISTTLSQINSAHLYFHGHLHESSGKSAYANTGAGITSLAAGAAYQGSKWEQSFAICEIDFLKKLLTPHTFYYAHDSGEWYERNDRSQPIPCRLPDISAQESNPSAEAQSTTTKPTEKWDNPFDLVVANDISAHEIPKLFVDKNSSINKISNKFESIVEGQRGTGKTMLLRYLSLEVQLELEKAHQMPSAPLLKYNGDYIGIYSRLSTSGFNRTDLQAITSADRRSALFDHRLVLYLTSKLIESLNALVPPNTPISTPLKLIQRRLARNLRNDDVKSAECWQDFSNMAGEICNERIEELDEHISSLLPGGYPIEFNPWLTISNSFFGLLKVVKQALEFNNPFFLLLDDFDALSREQQEHIFTIASERNHSLACFKFGIMTFGQKTTRAGKGRTYREGDDYDLISLNWHDKGLSDSRGTSSYKEAVIDIANKRLNASNWPGMREFSTLFNTWTHGNKIRKEVRGIAHSEYDLLPPNSRPQSFTNYWAKQGNAKYFRYLRSHKIEHRYAGPDTVVDVSSGIFRQFLELCNRVVAAALDTNWRPSDQKRIGPEVQNNVIRKYSDDMLRNLGETGGDTSSLSHGSIEVTSRHLVNLVTGLSTFFQNKLYSASRDPEVIAIAVKGDLSKSSFGTVLLDVAVRESILQRRVVDYSAKSSPGTRLPTYILNRRLAPRASLGLKLQGRHELHLSDIELAAKDTDAFIRKFCSRKSDTPNKAQGNLLDDPA